MFYMMSYERWVSAANLFAADTRNARQLAQPYGKIRLGSATFCDGGRGEGNVIAMPPTSNRVKLRSPLPMAGPGGPSPWSEVVHYNVLSSSKKGTCHQLLRIHTL